MNLNRASLAAAIAQGKKTAHELAEMFGVSINTIYSRKRLWGLADPIRIDAARKGWHRRRHPVKFEFDYGRARVYVKKPVMIQAYQVHEEVLIPTLEGVMKASPGDYIIQGVRGECYPCKPDIFERTYEPLVL